jgi:soluble lytic murein transglycosylase-like protein
VGGESSWRDLAEMDLRFARSRRRAEARRREPPRRSRVAWRSLGAGLLALLLLALAAESTRVEASGARPSKRRAAWATLKRTCPVPAGLRAAFANAAATTGVPLQLLVATAYQESRMNPQAQSGAGARGLLQLMPATARELRLAGGGPRANVLAGARYLRQMLNRFGNVDLALAAYNAGPGAVERAGAAPTIKTLRYVKNVEERAERLPSCR